MLVLNKIKRSLIIGLLTLIVVSCKKDPEIPFCELHPDECVDVREVKDAFYFDHGSWWVYEEENSGKRDSVYVISTTNDTGSYYFSTELYSTYDGYDYVFWTNSLSPNVINNLTKKSDSRATSVYRAKTKAGDFIAESKCFGFYPNVGFEMPNYGGEPFGYNNILKVENVFTEYSNGFISFQHVIHYSEEHTAVEETQPTHHFYSRGIGLVRKELIDSNQVWNLIDYHIVK